MEARSTRPILVYDGDCEFCSRWVESWRTLTRGAVEYLPADRAKELPPTASPERLAESVLLVRADGTSSIGARAVFDALAAGGPRWPRRLYRWVPGFALLSEGAYRVVARHRGIAAALDRLLFGTASGHRLRPSRWHVLALASLAYPTLLAATVGGAAWRARAPSSRRSRITRSAARFAARLPRPTPHPGLLVRWTFLRLLGIVYLAAFLSLLVQVRGLVGEKGILPLRSYLEFVEGLEGRRAVARYPTLFWLSSDDRTLIEACLGGALLSAALLAGIAPMPALLALWALYLSLSVGGQSFLQFQWDALLIETGLLSVLYAPPGVRPGLARERPPHPLVLLLLRALLFRVMFSSGVAKRVSGDRSWREATALQHHYETQPLPTWTSYRVHQLPPSIHRLCVYGVWVTELVAPPLGLGTRRMRQVAFVSTVLLQALISATGNYGFFNLLTAALALPLLDDDAFPRRFRSGSARPRRLRRRASTRRWPPDAFAVPAGVLLLALGAIPMAHTCQVEVPWPARLKRLYQRAVPLQFANTYGLFAVMTTERPEIIIEGSTDLREWRAYEFKWKPGDPTRRPRFTGLHLPRLDWLMWFAALAPRSNQYWLLPFLARLLEGSEPVRRLLAHDPFPEGPPRFVRARVYAYRFAPSAERRVTGAWWRRDLLYELVPGASLDAVVR